MKTPRWPLALFCGVLATTALPAGISAGLAVVDITPPLGGYGASDGT